MNKLVHPLEFDMQFPVQTLIQENHESYSHRQHYSINNVIHLSVQVSEL